MKYEVKTRQAVPRDLDPCCQIEKSCYRPSEAATKGKIQKRINEYPEGFWVAEIGNRVIGFINSGATNKVDLADERFKDMIGHESDGRNVVILSIAVHKKFQGQGIAGLLLSQFISQMEIASKDNLFLICKSDLIAFYKKYGFDYLRVSKSRHGGFKWHEMVLTLNSK